MRSQQPLVMYPSENLLPSILYLRRSVTSVLRLFEWEPSNLKHGDNRRHTALQTYSWQWQHIHSYRAVSKSHNHVVTEVRCRPGHVGTHLGRSHC